MAFGAAGTLLGTAILGWAAGWPLGVTLTVLGMVALGLAGVAACRRL